MNKLEDEFNEKIRTTSFNLLGSNGLDIEYLFTQRKELLTDWANFTESYLKLTSADKMMYLGQDILLFSMFNDEEVMNIMKRLNVGKNVTKYFIDLEAIFQSVQNFIEKSKFNWSTKHIMACYYAYSLAFMLNELKQNLDIDLNNFLLGLHRREEKDALDKYEQSVLESIQLEQDLLDKKNENLKIPRYEDGLRKLYKKAMRYAYKFNYNNMYCMNYNINLDVMEDKRAVSDFKCDFYDLAEITLRDKTILKNDEDSVLNYGEPGNRRFKIKRVEQLFLNLSDYYSR
ncbi:hypothetical protein [uncultured Psychroserpens sp.]|uniref:hypothetical protein n=1 Tax=uncultured Psychroserpens sp. TaxID=255436 RepID=UPI002633BDC3|nr:hypothetical protein [uncultured Psychroserpens sp.]